MGAETLVNSLIFQELRTVQLEAIKIKLGYEPIPEAIFYYAYAIFHSPTYRQRYAEFLKIDFPRLPLTSNPDLFKALAAEGEKIVNLHLLNWTVRSSRKINEFTRVSAPNAPQPSSGLTITERLSLQGF